MKSIKFFTSLFALSLFLCLTLTAVSNTANRSTIDNPKKTENNTASVEKSKAVLLLDPIALDNEFNYLRFDVNKYINENEAIDMVSTSLDYLRFEVTDYISDIETEITELPVANEFEYLFFDVKKFSGPTGYLIDELPVKE